MFLLVFIGSSSSINNMIKQAFSQIDVGQLYMSDMFRHICVIDIKWAMDRCAAEKNIAAVATALQVARARVYNHEAPVRRINCIITERSKMCVRTSSRRLPRVHCVRVAYLA
uniref:Uncharacterized protein n=1 Tax=Trichogramma kaykai TaxID=54128 RepID=A0ABD2W881_9HYME